MVNHLVFPELVGSIHQIFPHQVLRKRKMTQGHRWHNLKALSFPDFSFNPIPDARNIDAAFISRQFSLQAADVDPEIRSEHLQQGGVETGFVVVSRQLDAAGPDEASFERDRRQDQRRQVIVVALVSLPAQKAQG